MLRDGDEREAVLFLEERFNVAAQENGEAIAGLGEAVGIGNVRGVVLLTDLAPFVKVGVEAGFAKDVDVLLICLGKGGLHLTLGIAGGGLVLFLVRLEHLIVRVVERFVEELGLEEILFVLLGHAVDDNNAGEILRVHLL